MRYILLLVVIKFNLIKTNMHYQAIGVIVTITITNICNDYYVLNFNQTAVCEQSVCVQYLALFTNGRYRVKRSLGWRRFLGEHHACIVS